MSEASYVKKAFAVAGGGALLIAMGAAYLASQAPQRPEKRWLIEVSCLRVERGPTLRFSDGIIEASGAPVGTYKFLPAVGGKHGPLIEVRGIAVRQASGKVVIEQGNQDWFWPFLNDNTVQIFYFRLNSMMARRCPN